MTNGPVLFDHSHQPVYRVVRRSWRNPLDATFSQRPSADNRWNTNSFPALYCCCSVTVARAVALDVLRYAGIELTDLRPDVQPRLVEISWSGEVVDVATASGVQAAGFPGTYPSGVSKQDTRRAASQWHRMGLLGVVCRSASLSRKGLSVWHGQHESWGEVAVFVNNGSLSPSAIAAREDLDWLK